MKLISRILGRLAYSSRPYVRSVMTGLYKTANDIITYAMAVPN
jgi:hypothetical protein